MGNMSPYEIDSIDKRIWDKIESIKRIRFFYPRSLEEANSILPKVDEIIDKYIDALQPWKKPDMSLSEATDAAKYEAKSEASRVGRGDVWNAVWDKAWDKAWEKVKDEAWEKVRVEVWSEVEHVAESMRWDMAWGEVENVVRGMVWGVAEEVAEEVAEDMAWGAAWDVIVDLEKFNKNPFSYVNQLYVLGLMPNGFQERDGEEKYVVDIPIKYKDVNRYCWGCYAHRDGKIQSIHSWRYHSKNPEHLKQQIIVL